jgi:hypothetical protein
MDNSEKTIGWRRITVVTDETYEKLMVEQARKHGVESYICTYCSGKPLHDTFERLHATHALVRIELLALQPTADAFVRDIQQMQSLNYPVMATVDDVMVCGRRSADFVSAAKS